MKPGIMDTTDWPTMLDKVQHGHTSLNGVAILMATHDLFRAKESGTRVGIMKHGTMVALLNTGDIGHADLERLYLEHMHD